MDSANRHTMVLEHTHPTGVEEWACPTCGRRFIAQWEPTLKRLILNPGDDGAIHAGGNLQIETQFHPAPDAEDFAADTELDSLWNDWLNTLDFGPDDSPDSLNPPQ